MIVGHGLEAVNDGRIHVEGGRDRPVVDGVLRVPTVVAGASQEAHVTNGRDHVPTVADTGGVPLPWLIGPDGSHILPVRHVAAH